VVVVSNPLQVKAQSTATGFRMNEEEVNALVRLQSYRTKDHFAEKLVDEDNHVGWLRDNIK
jgi:hypothetical protein